MRVAIMKTNGYIDQKIDRALMNNGIKGDFIQKVTRQTINSYDAIIFSYKNNIPNITKVLEQISLEKKVLVVYINSTLSIGQFYNLLHDEFFTLINESRMDFELPSILQNSMKFIKKIRILNAKFTDVEEELNLLKTTNKAKMILMSKGLSEAESHKFIQRKAMELRTTKKNLVSLIIENKIDIP